MTAPYRFRPVTDDDFDFIYQLHRTTMREYIEPLWGWHEEWQEEYFRKKFDPANRQIIQINNVDSGVLVVKNQLEGIYLSLIEILPGQQNKGVGTAIVKMLMDRAAERHMTLSLHVLKTNQPAQRLYQRLGFQIVAEEGHRYKMVYYPSFHTDNVITPESHPINEGEDE